MKRLLFPLLGGLLAMGLAGGVFASDTALPNAPGKVRILITQDGEVDDSNSLIHTLLYANDFDLEGIVQTSSKLHYSGDEENEPLRWMGTDWMFEILDAYEAVYDCLVVHDPEYPTPESLREMTKIGNISMVSDTSQDTEGSDLVKERILAEDERPLLIVVGGGANTVARALMSIEQEYGSEPGWQEMYDHICENVILTCWGMQDDCYKEYIQPNWPSIRTIDVSGSTLAYGYRWATLDVLSPESVEKMSSAWMEEHLEKNHGPLMDLYVTWGDGTHLEGEEAEDQYGENEELLGDETLWVGHAYEKYDFLSEGDSPAWFLAIPNGLRSMEDISYGGWAGRYALRKSDDGVRLYQAAKGNEKGISAWIAAIQSDFAMRADWCIAPTYEEANHLPELSVEEGIDLTADAGETVVLHATVQDPDGDEVLLRWYHYPLGDSYQEAQDEEKNPVPIQVEVSGEANSEASLTVPEDAKSGDEIHVILEGVDAGGTSPVAYQRVIIKVN